MSLRPIDTQLSLSRTMDAGTMQHHLNQKSVVDQQAMAAHALKQAELESARSNQVDKTAKSHIQDDSSRDGERHKDANARDKETKQDDEHAKNEHPYKGKFIDFSL